MSESPWSTDATVIVDVASVAHWLVEDFNRRIATAHSTVGTEGASPPEVPRAVAELGMHRIVDVLAHHGVLTGHLMLGLPLGVFPPRTTGWAPRASAKRLRRLEEAIRRGSALVERVRAQLEPRGIVVSGLPGMIGVTGEHCVDELCVVAAAHASWSEEHGRDVIVISMDADVAIAPLLAGPGRILLARHLRSREAKELAGRLDRHGSPDRTAKVPPAHLGLLVASLRTMLRPEDLPRGQLQDAVAALPVEEAPPVELVEIEGSRVLRNGHDAKQVLSSSLDAAHERTWFDRRQPLLEPEGVRTTVVVDPFGLLATANRCDIAGRIPTAESVTSALAPLGLPEPVGQLAVIPDLLDADHGLIGLAGRVGGVDLVPRMRAVLTERIRARIVDLDDELESSLDSYEHDELPETVATASVFGRTRLSEITSSEPALEEKESATLLAVDLLWALMHTEGPVVLLSDRSDLVGLLDVVADHFPDLRMTGRFTRVGMQSEPFTAEGLRVERSSSSTRWPTMLLTGRMIADLLRIDGARGAGPDEPRTPPEAITEAISYDPVAHRFAVSDLDGRRAGEVTLGDVVQFPVRQVDLMEQDEADAATQLTAMLGASLRLSLDLRTPLPRARLTDQEDGERVIAASIVSARVVGHTEGGVRVRMTSGPHAGHPVVARTSGIAAVTGSEMAVEIVRTDDGEHHQLLMPDLADVPDAVGRPRPARVIGAGRVELLDPLDRTDTRGDAGTQVRSRALLGPYPAPEVGDVVLVTALSDDLVQIVSTPLAWLDRAGA